MSFLLSVAVGALSAILCYTLSISLGSYNQPSVAVLAVSLFFTIATMVHASFQRSGTAVMILNAYLTIFYIFPGMLHVATNSYPFYGLVYNSSEVFNAALLVMMFTSTSALGSGLVYSRQPQFPLHVEAARPARFMKSWVMVVLAVVSMLLVIRLGPGNFLQRRSDEVTTDVGSEVGLMLFSIARTLPVVALAGALHRIKFQGWSKTNIIALLGLFAANAVANFPLAIPRFTLFGVIITLLPLVIDVTRRRFKVPFLSGLILGVGTIFPLASFLQRGAEGTSFTFDFLGYFQTSGDLDGFQSTINVSGLVSDVGISWGWQLLSALLFFVPRSSWPAKGYPTGVISADHAGYAFLNISSPLPSEFYADFGYAGCAFGGLIVGYAATFLDHRFINSQNRRSLRHHLLFGGMSAYLIILLRGPLLGVAGPIALFFAISLFSTISPFLTAPRRRRPGQQKPRQTILAETQTSTDPITWIKGDA